MRGTKTQNVYITDMWLNLLFQSILSLASTFSFFKSVRLSLSFYLLAKTKPIMSMHFLLVSAARLKGEYK